MIFISALLLIRHVCVIIRPFDEATEIGDLMQSVSRNVSEGRTAFISKARYNELQISGKCCCRLPSMEKYIEEMGCLVIVQSSSSVALNSSAPCAALGTRRLRNLGA